MHTAVIKFNPLPDSVGSATKNHDLFLIRFFNLIFIPIGGIIIRGKGFKFCSTGIYQTKSGLNPEGYPPRSDLRWFTIPKICKLTIRKAGLFCLAQGLPVDCLQAGSTQVFPDSMEFFQLGTKPWINTGLLGDILPGHSHIQGFVQIHWTISRGSLHSCTHRRFIKFLISKFTSLKSFQSDLQGAHCFLKGLFKSTTNGHSFPH